jgi:hypothetical protein
MGCQQVEIGTKKAGVDLFARVTSSHTRNEGDGIPMLIAPVTMPDRTVGKGFHSKRLEFTLTSRRHRVKQGLPRRFSRRDFCSGGFANAFRGYERVPFSGRLKVTCRGTYLLSSVVCLGALVGLMVDTKPVIPSEVKVSGISKTQRRARTVPSASLRMTGWVTAAHHESGR